jgi:hypothetical protein
VSLGVEETNYLRHVDDVTCHNSCGTRCNHHLLEL